MSMDDERDEGIDVDALDKTLIKLTQVIEKLTQDLGKFGDASTKNNKRNTVDHDKIHKQNMERQKEYFANVEAMKRLSAELKNGTQGFQQFTGYLTKGVGISEIFKKLHDSVSGVIETNEKYKKAKEELAEMEKKYGSIGDSQGKGKDERWAGASADDRKKGSELKQTVDAGANEGKVVDALAGAKEFYKKHKTGILIGTASVGILLLVLKKAFSASPMFQSMLKLLKFGIMLVLRPIGDFFGFIMRPIMIMLLRKFIIPWYTKLYPVMIKMGDLIGKKLSGAFEALAQGDIAGAFAFLFKDVDLHKILTDSFADIHKWIEETDWEKVQKDIANAVIAFGVGLWEYIIEPIGRAVYEELSSIDWDGMFKTWGDAMSDWFDTGLKNVETAWNSMWVTVYEWFSGGVDSIYNAWNWLWQSVWKWFSEGVDGMTTAWDDYWTSVKDWFEGGVKSVAFSTTKFWDDVMKWFEDGINSISTSWQSIWSMISNWFKRKLGLGGGSSRPDVQEYNGGQINEPIFGIGQSGKTYSFGERGSETVTPNSQINNNNIGGATTININIERVEKDADFNQLKPMIQRWILEANSRRGMI